MNSHTFTAFRCYSDADVSDIVRDLTSCLVKNRHLRATKVNLHQLSCWGPEGEMCLIMLNLMLDFKSADALDMRRRRGRAGAWAWKVVVALNACIRMGRRNSLFNLHYCRGTHSYGRDMGCNDIASLIKNTRGDTEALDMAQKLRMLNSRELVSACVEAATLPGGAAVLRVLQQQLQVHRSRQSDRFKQCPQPLPLSRCIPVSAIKDECPVCGNANVKGLLAKCGHEICESCAMQWVDACNLVGRVVTCPMCRSLY